MSTTGPAAPPPSVPTTSPVPTPDLAADPHEHGHRAPQSALAAIGDRCDAVDGTISVVCAPVALAGEPWREFFARHPEEPHYAASTMKVAAMVAAYRSADAGDLTLAEPVPVHARFTSVVEGAGTFECTASYDSDPQVWERLGSSAPLGWLVHRSIVRSSNLATNLILERLGFTRVEDVYRLVGAPRCTLRRMIQDAPGLDAGVTNTVTARGLARLLGAIANATAASATACAEMLGVLRAQEWRDDIVRGLPSGTTVAHKNGWVDGVRHSIALIEPDDAPRYLLAICTTSALSDTASADLLADIAAASWADRLAVAALR